MYNKLFTKILDSSIWLQPDATRIVWITILAAMDEDGYVQFSALGNLAGRARVTIEDAAKAVECLEGPDSSGDQEFEGRRIERVEGGWMVLNATKHRDMVTRAVKLEANRRRVSKYRAKKKHPGNAPVMQVKRAEMQSEAYSVSHSKEEEAAALDKYDPPKDMDVEAEHRSFIGWCTDTSVTSTSSRWRNWVLRAKESGRYAKAPSRPPTQEEILAVRRGIIAKQDAENQQCT